MQRFGETVDFVDDYDELLRRCGMRDVAALTQLVRACQDRIYQLACRVAGDESLAEEATAQALVKIWERASQWRGDASATTWIYRMAVSTVLDVRRGQHRWWRRWAAGVVPEQNDPLPGPAERLAGAEQRQYETERLERAIARLSDSDRVLVSLYYFENMGLAEIETVMDVPRANLKMRLSRARDRLRHLLGEQTDHEEGGSLQRV